jgi:outer membrane lipoprotein SlyB
MDAVTNTNHQSRSTRTRLLVVAVAVSAAVAVLIGFGAASGKLPGKHAQQDEAVLPRGEPKPGEPGTCALCGTIEAVKTVEVYDEPSGATGTAEVRGGAETAGSGPGGAIASGAASVLDTLRGVLSGSASDQADNRVRKRLVWRVTLRMDDGSYRAVSLPSPPAFAVGEKVRVVEGRLVRA